MSNPVFKPFTVTKYYYSDNVLQSYAILDFATLAEAEHFVKCKYESGFVDTDLEWLSIVYESTFNPFFAQ